MGKSRVAVRRRAEEPEGDFHLAPSPGLRRLPRDAKLMSNLKRYAQAASERNFGKAWSDERIDDEWEKFCVWHWRKGDKCRDWSAAWMSWVRIAISFQRQDQIKERPRGPKF